MMLVRNLAIQRIVSPRAFSMCRLSAVLFAKAFLTIAIACTLATGTALAFETYLVDVKAKSSKIIPKWQSIVPGPLSTNAWINSLEGLSPPIDDLVIFYKKFYLG